MSNPVSIEQLKGVVRKLHEQERLSDVSIYLSGPPGIGKTAALAQLAKELDADYQVFLACTMDPTDITGLPFPVDGLTRFLPPERLVQLTEKMPNKRFTFAVFDDLPATHEQVFAALFRFFYERRVGEEKIRKNVLLAATGNRAADMAGAKELPTALANRFIHYEIRVDFEEWISWAYVNNIDPMVISWVRSTSGRTLHDFDPARGEVCFPSPRSVAMASLIYGVLGHADNQLLLNSLAGCCGENWAHGFITYSEMREKLVPVEDIFANPNAAPIPNDIDVAWAVITNLICAVARSVTPETVNGSVAYGLRFGQRDMGARLVREVVRIAGNGEHTDIYDQIAETLAEAKKKFGNLYTIR